MAELSPELAGWSSADGPAPVDETLFGSIGSQHGLALYRVCFQVGFDGGPLCLGEIRLGGGSGLGLGCGLAFGGRRLDVEKGDGG
jgi:hypothetical protein